MTSPDLPMLENLARLGHLKPEPFDAQERIGLLRSARIRLRDAQQNVLAAESRFDLGYNAAHAAALSALRFQGYRSENRYLVFQCLGATLGYLPEQWLVLDLAHKKRNLAEYEGSLDITESFVQELLQSVAALLIAAEALAPV